MRFLLVTILLCYPAAAQTLPDSRDLDAVINQAVRDDVIPGAVLLIGHNGHIVYRNAYGNRALLPAKEPMTVNTVFDIASLTKVVATTSCIMKLFEEGRIWLDAPVTTYLPEFQGGQSPITIRDLMTHFSGERPDLVQDPPWTGYETGIHRALIEKPVNPPGAKFVYSDINFILLGEVIKRLSGMPENDYAKKILFDPLGMKDTGYLPNPALKPRIAPTEMQKDGTVLRGVVHDPTARFMGGVAGDAAHETGCGIVNDAPQDGAVFLHFRGRDARLQCGIRQVAGVLHAERIAEDLFRVVVFGHAAPSLNNFAQQDEIDIAVNEFRSRRVNRLFDEGAMNPGFVAGPGRI